MGQSLGVGWQADTGSMGKKMEGVVLKLNMKLGGDNVRLVGGA